MAAKARGKQELVMQLGSLKTQLEKHATMQSPQLQTIPSASFLEMQQDIKEIKAAMAIRTYVQVTAATTMPAPSPTLHLRAKVQRHEVTLTTRKTTDKIIGMIQTAAPSDITQICQSAIDQSLKEGDIRPKLDGIQKLARSNIRIQCKTAEEVETLRKVDWNKAYKGLAVHKPQFGFAIHGVPSDELEI